MKKKLLVVDDDRSICRSLEKVLRAEGFEVFTACDGLGAIHCFESNPIDLVILDINLGNDDGWAVFKAMTALNPFIPTIIITAEWGQRERAIELGAEALVEKPIDVPSFLELIGGLLAQSAENGLRRICDNENYCRYLAKDFTTVSRMLTERCDAPLRLSHQMIAALPHSCDPVERDTKEGKVTVIGDALASGR